MLRSLQDGLESPSFEAPYRPLADKRVLVVGLGPLAECVLGLLEQGIGSGQGFVRLVGLPGEHASGLEFGRWLAGHVPQLEFQECATLESLAADLESCDLVLDAIHFQDVRHKPALYRIARDKQRPVVAVYPTGSGATAYCFHPDNPTLFEDVFSLPPESVRTGWKLPLGRLVLQDDPENQFSLFQVLNGLRPAPIHPMSREAVRMLCHQLVFQCLQGQPAPQAPVACFLEPQQFHMGTVHLGAQMAEQSQSIWTRIASVYDEFLLGGEQNVYRDLLAKIHEDLGGCSRVLEAGCGTGSICQMLAQAGVETYGIDRNLAMLARASAKAATTPGMYVADGDVQKLYFPDEYFDGYCSNNVVFDADIVLTLREAYRVLKPGGRLCIASSKIMPDIQALGAIPAYMDQLEAGVAEEFVACQKEIYAGRSLKYGFQTHGVSKVEKLLQEVGFRSLLKSDTVYVGHSFYLLAEK